MKITFYRLDFKVPRDSVWERNLLSVFLPRSEDSYEVNQTDAQFAFVFRRRRRGKGWLCVIMIVEWQTQTDFEEEITASIGRFKREDSPTAFGEMFVFGGFHEWRP